VDDIVKRLRANLASPYSNAKTTQDAIDEIERLRAALRALLDMDVAYGRGPKVEEAVEAARAALGESHIEPTRR
jgi:acetylglutamate kinase